MEKEGRSVGWLSFNEKIHNNYTPHTYTIDISTETGIYTRGY